MKKRVLSLFSCGGGMDIGFEGGFKILKCSLNTNIHNDWIEYEDDKYYYLKDTGFETVFANDIVEYAKATWVDYFNRKRQKDVSDCYIVRSIVDLVKDYHNGNKDIFPQNIDIVTGGFPCQDFSVAGKRKGFNSEVAHNGDKANDDIPSEETRGKLYMWMKEVIEITRPKMFIAENVKGLANLGDVKNIIQRDFATAGGDGYIVLDPQVLHAGRYGVSQSRERIFFIGIRKNALTAEALNIISNCEPFSIHSPYPSPTHSLPKDNSLFNESASDIMPFVPCRKILEDLDEPNISNDLSQISYSKAKFIPHLQGNVEIKPNGLAPTIRSEHHGNIEFRRLSEEHGGNIKEELNLNLNERRLTLRECARIQSFPDDYNFVIKDKKYIVSPSAGYKLVGNAVPPLLAYHIAKKIESNWDSYFG